MLGWDSKYLTNHNLHKDSIVFDVWGYIWIFSDEIIRKYDCYMYIFEPVKEYYDTLVKKYKNSNKIKILQFWLSDIDENVEISRLDNATSIYKNEGKKEQIKLVDFKTFIMQENLEDLRVDLISINIEWWEYPLINRILETYPNMMEKIQVQFHDFIDNSDQKRDDVLKKSYEKWYKKWYSFPFVWELFIKRK